MTRALWITIAVLSIIILLAGGTISLLSTKLFNLSLDYRITKREHALEIERMKMLRGIEMMTLLETRGKENLLNDIRRSYEKIDVDNLDAYLDRLMELQNNPDKSGTD